MKPKVRLLRFDVLLEVAEVLTEGIKKHGEYGWRTKDPKYYEDKALRHMFKRQLNKKDESGHDHAIHAIADLMLMLDIENKKYGTNR